MKKFVTLTLLLCFCFLFENVSALTWQDLNITKNENGTYSYFDPSGVEHDTGHSDFIVMSVPDSKNSSILITRIYFADGIAYYTELGSETTMSKIYFGSSAMYWLRIQSDLDYIVNEVPNSADSSSMGTAMNSRYIVYSTKDIYYYPNNTYPDESLRQLIFASSLKSINIVATMNSDNTACQISATYSGSDNYAIQYSIGGSSWLNYTNLFTVDKNCTISFRVIQDGEVVATKTYSIDKIGYVSKKIDYDVSFDKDKKIVYLQPYIVNRCS